MNKTDRAKQFFHQRTGLFGRLNCAQAILKAFEDEADISPQTIKKASFHGGGKAPGGMCGALYAGRKIIKDEQEMAAVEKSFAHRAGSTLCREIRSHKQISCVACVALAAEILQISLCPAKAEKRQ